MSDTPRTDALLNIASIEDRYRPLLDLGRQLERELANANALLLDADETRLDPAHASLSISPDGEISMHLPKMGVEDDAEPVADYVLWITAMGARYSSDKEWRADLLAWWVKQAASYRDSEHG